MPRFQPDPSTVTIGFPVYPKDTYLVELSEPKTFFGVGKPPKPDNHGVGFRSSKIAEGEYKNKPFPINCFQHSEGGLSYSKAIQMVAFGYNPRNKEDIKKFDANEGTLDWSYDTDTNTAGDGWHKMKGKIIKVEVDTRMDTTSGVPEEVQDVKQFLPF